MKDITATISENGEAFYCRLSGLSGSLPLSLAGAGVKATGKNTSFVNYFFQERGSWCNNTVLQNVPDLSTTEIASIPTHAENIIARLDYKTLK